MHCTKVSEVRKKPVPALGEIRELNFLSLFPRAEKFFPSNSDLGFSFGLTQAIHIHATVLGSGGLGHACVYGAGGGALSTAHERTHTPSHASPMGSACLERRRKSCQSSPDAEGKDPGLQQT